VSGAGWPPLLLCRLQVRYLVLRATAGKKRLDTTTKPADAGFVVLEFVAPRVRDGRGARTISRSTINRSEAFA